jgi:hypothetical protein
MIRFPQRRHLPEAFLTDSRLAGGVGNMVTRGCFDDVACDAVQLAVENHTTEGSLLFLWCLRQQASDERKGK